MMNNLVREMADAILDDISQSTGLNKETIGNVDTCCYNCQLLKLKLQEVSSELSSAREIIKILQEEVNSIQRKLEKPREPQQNREVIQASIEDPYTNWTIRKPGRKCARRNYGHPRQEVFPIHVNRFNVLRTLIEPQIVDLPTPHKTLTTTVEPRSIVPATIVFPHVLFAIFGPELSSI